jgi:hypothetical protein
MFEGDGEARLAGKGFDELGDDSDASFPLYASGFPLSRE